MATSLSDKVIPTALPVADKDKAINRKASQPPGKAPLEQKPAPALDQTKPAAGRPTAARSSGQMAICLVGEASPTTPTVADKPQVSIAKVTRLLANTRVQKHAIKRLQRDHLSADNKEICELISATMENKIKTKATKPNETSVQTDSKQAQGHRIWGRSGKKDIMAVPTSSLQASSSHKPPGMKGTQHKVDPHPTPTVRNQVTRPKYSHSGRTSSHRDKRSRLSYTRHTLDPIPESQLQHEVWTSQLWASNPTRNLSPVSVPKRLRISQLPKAGTPNSLHQQNKASKIS